MTNIQWVGVIWAGTLVAFAAVMWWSTRSTSAANQVADQTRAEQRHTIYLRQRRHLYERQAQQREQVQ